jgi:hypothetical protein
LDISAVALLGSTEKGMDNFLSKGKDACYVIKFKQNKLFSAPLEFLSLWERFEFMTRVVTND